MYDAIVPCKKCSNKVPASSLKMDIDLKMMVCPECVKNKKIHKEIEQDAFHKGDKPSQIQVSAGQTSEAKPDKIGHKCSSCSYKFKIDMKTRKPKNCPYCNARVMGI